VVSRRARASGFPILTWLLLGVAIFAGRVAAIDISISGDWTKTIDWGDLSAGAGSDLTGIHESASDQGVISIANTTGSSDAWRVDVSRTDTNWPGDFALYVKRTSDGTGNGGTISGGYAYQEVTTSSASLFSGTGNWSGIDICLKLTGVSLSVAPNTYSTTITYTLVDTP
jgi:hypothetical protein